MHDADLPVPGFLPTPLADPPSDLEDMALMFYGRLVACAERLESAEKQGRAQREEQMHQAHRTMARLAAQRFEFTRLSQRIRSELETLCPDHTETIDNVLGLFARNWDANLRRAGLEVIDLTGHPLTNELAEVVEVESAIPDASAREIVVRETLTPLVKVEGQVVALAKIITAVPVQDTKTNPEALL